MDSRRYCKWCATPLKTRALISIPACPHCDGDPHDPKSCVLCLAGDRVMDQVRRGIRRGV